MHHEVNWGVSNTLADQWWTPTLPTAILKVANANAQMVVTSVLLGLGYKPSEDYVFGAGVGVDRFYTGSYQVGPIEWAMQKLGRRRPAVYLIGVRVKERDQGEMERLAEWAPRINTTKDALEHAHVIELLQLPEAADKAFAGLLTLATVVTEVKLDNHGFVWPPIWPGDSQ